MTSGGARPGAGRPRKCLETRNFPAPEPAAPQPQAQPQTGGSAALALLQGIYNDTTLSIQERRTAATAALPYEAPKMTPVDVHTHSVRRRSAAEYTDDELAAIIDEHRQQSLEQERRQQAPGRLSAEEVLLQIKTAGEA